MKKPRISTEEKVRLIQLYFDSGESIRVFCAKHGLCFTSFTRWLKKYRTEGAQALSSKADRAYETIAPQLTTEADLRKEILRLRIENERLKKSYTVQTTEDGKTEYIRLKAKNTK